MFNHFKYFTAAVQRNKHIDDKTKSDQFVESGIRRILKCIKDANRSSKKRAEEEEEMLRQAIEIARIEYENNRGENNSSNEDYENGEQDDSDTSVESGDELDGNLEDLTED